MFQDRHLRCPAAALLVGLLLGGCGEPNAIQFPPPGSGTGGAIVLDKDLDSQLSDGDIPLSGATIEPLAIWSDGASGPSLRLPPQTRSTLSATQGDFVLDYGDATIPENQGVQVGIPVDLENGRGTGFVHLRFELQADRSDNVVLIPAAPTRCEAEAEIGVLPNDCGTLLLPDLIPIVDRSQIDPVHRGDPVAASNGERAAGPEDLGLLPPETWFIDETEDDRRLLRFASLSANLGDGVLDVVAETGGDNKQAAWQRIWTSDLRYWERRSGEFAFHEGHDHMHFDAFERYRLLDSSGQQVAQADKVSFCLRDSNRISGAQAPMVGVFTTYADSCGKQQQAINPGWGDHYDQFLPDQWIDVTGVPAGSYTVEITVDPMDRILESDESNNVGSFEVVID